MPFCAVHGKTFHVVAFKKHSHFMSVLAEYECNADEMSKI